jgi:hypothetical protein
MVAGDERLGGAVKAVVVVAVRVRRGRHLLQLYRRHGGQTDMVLRL